MDVDMKDIRSSEVVLERETHTYRLSGRPDLDFVSCTEFIDRFFEPFHAEEIAARLVQSSPRYRGMSVTAVLGEWQQAADDGSRVHHEIERALSHGECPRSSRALAALDWLEQALPRALHEYLPERIIYSEALGIAGTADLIAREHETGACVLLDWKTNKKITRRPYAGKQGIRGPARQLDDCHVVRYGLQLSLYHYILETEYGIDPRRQLLVHLGGSGVDPIPCDYARDAILEMIEFERR